MEKSYSFYLQRFTPGFEDLRKLFNDSVYKSINQTCFGVSSKQTVLLSYCFLSCFDLKLTEELRTLYIRALREVILSLRHRLELEKGFDSSSTSG